MTAPVPSSLLNDLSAEIARIVAGATDTEVVLLGGRYTEFDSCVGPDTIAALRKVRADIAVLSVTALAGARIYHPVREYAEVKTAILGACRQALLVVDHSKFGRQDFGHVAALSAIDTVITDSGLDDETVDDVESAGPEVVRA